MHYYSFNIADYKKDTAHLKPIEHYIYRSLIDLYYLDEKPIPLKTHLMMRRLCLATHDEEKMLLDVLNDFFEEHEDGFHHKRIESEINKYQSNAEKNRENGKKGGRPPRNKPKITQSVIDRLPVDSQINPNQKPVTTNQKPVTSLPFENFWNAYDYKKGGLKKPKAKWLSLDIGTQRLIMAHVPNYIRSTPNKGFRKYPLTYLNNEGWLDEIIIDKTPPSNNKPTASYSNMNVNAIYDDPNHDPYDGLKPKGTLNENN